MSGWIPTYGKGCPLELRNPMCHMGNYFDGTPGHYDPATGVLVPELGIKHKAKGLDPEIADLVIALNRAGIKTTFSCSRVCADPLTGSVTIGTFDFPKLAATLPMYANGEGNDGWLFALRIARDLISASCSSSRLRMSSASLAVTTGSAVSAAASVEEMNPALEMP